MSQYLNEFSLSLGPIGGVWLIAPKAVLNDGYKYQLSVRLFEWVKVWNFCQWKKTAGAL